MSTIFRNRIDAGRQLADRFRDLADRDDVVVLALPRGGVPVAAEVASAIKAPLDVLLVRKIGVPWQRELAMGAIASGDELVLDEEIITHLGVTQAQVVSAIDTERVVLLGREQTYRGDQSSPDLRGKIVLLIDDGLATGTTMRVAIQAARKHHPTQVMVGVPVGSPDRIRAISATVDRIECLHTPRGFQAVGQFYEDFRPTTDAEVISTLTAQRLAS